MKNSIIQLYKNPKTVLTNSDLMMLWKENDRDNLKSKASYYVRKGDLIRLRNGVFAKTREYDKKELATSIFSPSYISFETVLREEGVIFQYYETVFVAANRPSEITINGQKIKSRRIKDSVLFNTDGIELKGSYSIATKERALLDMLYIAPDYYFDNLNSIDWDKCFKLVKIYDNKALEKRLRRLKKDA